MINKVILVGNVGQDPEIRDAGNAKVANFTLATSESWKDKTSGERKTQTEWHNIVAWRHLAELSDKFIQKGSKLYIEGKIVTRSYEKQDNTKGYVTEIVANNITMLDPKNQNSTPAVATATNTSAASEDEEDDLPF